MRIAISEKNNKSNPNQEAKKAFLDLVEQEKVGFLNFPNSYDRLSKVEELAKTHANKKSFVHVGLGGSSLGPKMLLESLNLEKSKDFFFLDNSDPELFFEIIQQIDCKSSVFYIVSKSGSTLETMSLFQLILAQFEKVGLKSEQWKDHLVFCTDPNSSELLEIGKEYQVPTLEIPSNIGGRYSTLTEVGLFPLAFFNYSAAEFLDGAKAAQKEFVQNGSDLATLASTVVDYYKNKNVDQTIVMPYSSKLKYFSDWFVQLWAESLGKENIGLTPISSYGATDQHSQVQLFLDGPKNKFPLLIEVEKFRHETELLRSELKGTTAEKIKKFNLNQIIQAQFSALSQTFLDRNIPFAKLSIKTICAHELGELVMNSMILTSLVGLELKINPYDQPAVESVKINTWKYLNQI